MTREEEVQQLMGRAFRFLSIRPRSSAEIRHFLEKIATKRGSSDTYLVDEARERLTHLGYCNDLEFAKWWITARANRNQKGIRIIRFELKQKGVSPELIEEAIEGTKSIALEEEMICKLLVKKVRLWSGKSMEEIRMRMYQYIVRRGFSSDKALKIIDEFLKNWYNYPKV